MTTEKHVQTPTEQALESSVKNNIWFYYVATCAWIGFMLYAIVLKDAWLLLDAIFLFVAAIYFNLAQKIDKMRLEFQRK